MSKTYQRSSILAFVVLAGLLILYDLLIQFDQVQAGPSATFIVSNSNDSGAGSLRQAIVDANASAGEDLIDITAIGTINLLTPLPVISEAVTIQGSGSNQLIIDGGGSFRIFESTAVPLTVTNLTVQNGRPAADAGGGIRSLGALTLNNVEVLSNTGQFGGGGVYAAGEIQITNGRFQNNQSSTGLGGGLWSTIGAVISGTTFISNSGPGQGGGAVVQGHSRLTNVHFENNQATASSGGGLYASGRVTLTNATFISNTAFSDGGALLSFGQAEVYSSRFIDNQSADQGGAVYIGSWMTVTHSAFIGNSGGRGGALFHGTLYGWVQNSLFARNTATLAGAQLFLNSSFSVDMEHVTAVGSGTAVHNVNSDLTVTNSIIAEAEIGIDNLNGSVSQDYNLFWDNISDSQGLVSGGANNATGNPNFIDPLLDNYHLGPGSAAIDVGTDAGLMDDFDGELRPFGSGFDIGFDEFFIWPNSLYLPIVMR